MPPGAGADLAAARRLVREQRPREAMALLDAAAQAVGPLHPFAVRRTFDLVALAVAAGAAAEDEAARSAIERALDLAAPELLRRPFLDEMVRLRPLLERHVAAGSKHGAFVGDLLRRAEHGGPAALEAPLKEPLTERERTVLGLLPSGLTAAEIAATLTVSEATVRTHMRHIYEKLGVANRQDAIQRGVELRYLARDLLPNRYS
jgi:LuxR family maltose regulon positive regulatory protein